MKRYGWQTDELAGRNTVLAVLRELTERLDLKDFSEPKLVQFGQSIHNFLRYSPKTLRTGRKGKFERTLLLQASHVLTEILSRQTRDRAPIQRFLAHYLPVLKFPADVLAALESHRSSLEEAHLVNRLSARNFKGDGARARRVRQELLEQHVRYDSSQPRLKIRVKEILGELEIPSIEELSENMKHKVRETNALLEIDAYDSTHLLFEEIKNVFFTAREIEDADLDGELIDEILDRTSDLQFSLNRDLMRKSKRPAEGSEIE